MEFHTWDDPLGLRMATLAGVLAWKVAWTEEPAGLQPLGLQRVDPTEQLSTYIHNGGRESVSPGSGWQEPPLHGLRDCTFVVQEQAQLQDGVWEPKNHLGFGDSWSSGREREPSQSAGSLSASNLGINTCGDGNHSEQSDGILILATDVCVGFLK